MSYGADLSNRTIARLVGLSEANVGALLATLGGSPIEGWTRPAFSPGGQILALGGASLIQL
ncbi:MAG: hypothetical protein HXY40_13335 [Chloroflexi bacterium]|nr:hypothetical protein [Chloroflexota bacterium]